MVNLFVKDSSSIKDFEIGRFDSINKKIRYSEYCRIIVERLINGEIDRIVANKP